VTVNKITVFVSDVFARGANDIVLFFEELSASKAELTSFLNNDGVPAREV